MRLAILLAVCLAPAVPEWVEISQNHYRKPARTHTYTKVNDGPAYNPSEDPKLPHDYTKKEDTRLVPHLHKDPVRFTQTFPVEETVQLHNFPDYEESVYSNHSNEKHNWDTNKYRAPSNIKSFDNDVKVKANITPQFSLEIFETVTESVTEVRRNKWKDQDRVSATIERVPNKGNVKRVELSNTPVKSPSFISTETSPIRRNDIKNYGSTLVEEDYSDEFDIKSDILQDARKKLIGVTPYNDVKHIFNTVTETVVPLLTSTKATPVRSYDGIMTSANKAKNGITFPEHPTKTGIQMQTNNKTEIIKNLNVMVSNSNNRMQNTNKQDIKEHKPNFVINQYQNVSPDIEEIDFEEVIINNEDRIKPNQNNRPHKPNDQFSKERNRTQSSDTNSNENKTNEGIKVNTMENVIKFMKVVADTISKNSKRGVNGKVKYLLELKDTLLHNIKERIDATWPDDTGAPARRRSRAAAASRGHVEFPSSESALMTISFLTFAVFLIKLVLQVIQTYKNKAMVMAPLVVATAGRAAHKLRTSD